MLSLSPIACFASGNFPTRRVASMPVLSCLLVFRTCPACQPWPWPALPTLPAWASRYQLLARLVVSTCRSLVEHAWVDMHGVLKRLLQFQNRHYTVLADLRTPVIDASLALDAASLVTTGARAVLLSGGAGGWSLQGKILGGGESRRGVRSAAASVPLSFCPHPILAGGGGAAGWSGDGRCGPPRVPRVWHTARGLRYPAPLSLLPHG